FTLFLNIENADFYGQHLRGQYSNFQRRMQHILSRGSTNNNLIVNAPLRCQRVPIIWWYL
ncbi:unnamed protein product, partial [Allacma fusca]